MFPPKPCPPGKPSSVRNNPDCICPPSFKDKEFVSILMFPAVPMPPGLIRLTILPSDNEIFPSACMNISPPSP